MRTGICRGKRMIPWLFIHTSRLILALLLKTRGNADILPVFAGSPSVS
jgi:hypothetical protein